MIRDRHKPNPCDVCGRDEGKISPACRSIAVTGAYWCSQAGRVDTETSLLEPIPDPIKVALRADTDLAELARAADEADATYRAAIAARDAAMRALGDAHRSRGVWIIDDTGNRAPAARPAGLSTLEAAFDAAVEDADVAAVALTRRRVAYNDAVRSRADQLMTERYHRTSRRAD